MLKPHKPLSAAPLTKAQEARLINDVYIAIRMAEWVGCCMLCGWPVYIRGKGRMKRFDHPTYGKLCRVCARAQEHTAEALHALDRLREYDSLEGR